VITDPLGHRAWPGYRPAAVRLATGWGPALAGRQGNPHPAVYTRAGQACADRATGGGQGEPGWRRAGNRRRPGARTVQTGLSSGCKRQALSKPRAAGGSQVANRQGPGRRPAAAGRQGDSDALVRGARQSATSRPAGAQQSGGCEVESIGGSPAHAGATPANARLQPGANPAPAGRSGEKIWGTWTHLAPLGPNVQSCLPSRVRLPAVSPKVTVYGRWGTTYGMKKALLAGFECPLATWLPACLRVGDRHRLPSSPSPVTLVFP